MLGGLDDLEAQRPKVKPRIYQLYSIFNRLRRDADEMKPIKADAIFQASAVLNYEQDKAVRVVQAADDHYLKMCADKIKRMNQK
jgi:hypothetical protein